MSTYWLFLQPIVFNELIRWNFLFLFLKILEKQQMMYLADQMKNKAIFLKGKNYYGRSKIPYNGRNKCGTKEYRLFRMKFEYLFGTGYSGAYMVTVGWIEGDHLVEVNSYINLNDFATIINSLPTKLKSVISGFSMFYYWNKDESKMSLEALNQIKMVSFCIILLLLSFGRMKEWNTWKSSN